MIGSGDRRAAALVLTLAVFVHLFRGLALFPSLSDAVDERPILSGDHPFHLYFAHRGLELLGLHGADWGYLPDFLGGFPKTTYYDASVVPLEFFAAAGRLSPERTDKAMLLAIPLLELVCTVLAVYLLGGMDAIPIAAAAQVAFFWLGDGWLLLAVGLSAFLISSSLFVCIATLWMTERHLPALAMAPILTFFHPHGMVMLALLAAAGLAAGRPYRHRMLRALALIAVGALGLAPLARSLVDESSLLLPTNVSQQFLPQDAGELGRYLTGQGYHQRSGGPIAAIFWTGAVFEVVRRRSGEKRACLLLLALLFLLTFFGGLHPRLANLQSTRLKHPLAILALALGAPALGRAIAVGWSRPVIRATLAAGAVGMLGTILLLGVRSHPVVRVGVSDQERELISFIDAHTTERERVLIESSEAGGIFGYASSDDGVLALLPILTGRTFLNGPNPYVYLVHGILHPLDGSWLGARASTLGRDRLERVLSVMGVRLVGVVSGAWRQAIERLSGWHRIHRIGRLFLYQFDERDATAVEPASGAPPGTGRSASGDRASIGSSRAIGQVVKGAARVTWSTGLIELSEVRPAPDGRLTLAFLFDAALEAQPRCVIEPVPVEGLPLPLIGIVDPPAHVVLGPRGGWSSTGADGSR